MLGAPGAVSGSGIAPGTGLGKEVEARRSRSGWAA